MDTPTLTQRMYPRRIQRRNMNMGRTTTRIRIDRGRRRSQKEARETRGQVMTEHASWRGAKLRT